MGSTGDRIKEVLRRVPCGRVATYGGIAAITGLPNGARTVARLLHSSAKSDALPWWRIVRVDGTIALRPGAGMEEQVARLADEGIAVGKYGRVDLAAFGWQGA
ncbi:MAG: DNA methyltransferase [Spirochaetae bacterium HGW-Spirochaetae-7]|jgi:methylated-DNA-protein-cysteine methyltransferase-like protein|nr:MAG: DNA methyltransferase [Spirochaetae bacterium HGW-Spirochaetae-7]